MSDSVPSNERGCYVMDGVMYSSHGDGSETSRKATDEEVLLADALLRASDELRGCSRELAIERRAAQKASGEALQVSKEQLTDGALAALVENIHGYVDTASLLHWQVITCLRELQQRRASNEPEPDESDADTCRLAFQEWANELDLCLDEIFMSSDGVPEHPYEDNDTNQFWRAWLASWKAKRTAQPPESVPAAEYEQHINLAVELEREGVRQVLAAVSAIAGDRTDAYWAAHSNACEEVLHRLQSEWGESCKHCATQGLPASSQPPASEPEEGCARCSNVAPIAKIMVADGFVSWGRLYAPGLPNGQHDLYPVASSQPPDAPVAYRKLHDSPYEPHPRYLYRDDAVDGWEPLYARATQPPGVCSCWETINALIKPGELQGNGCDQTAQRNGLILAANAILAKRHSETKEV